MEKVTRTWNEFWGKFLLVDFHLNNPERWTSIERKADWVWATGNVSTGERILDLGCGSGLLDICLARKGATVIAIDRIKPVLELAKQENGGSLVTFIHDDLMNVSYPTNSFDLILVLETIGLMNRDNDKRLLGNIFEWLKPGGRLIVDCPKPEHATHGRWTKDLPEGALTFESSFEAGSSIQTIVPTLKTASEVIMLHDPYSSDVGDHWGVKRHLYPELQLRNILSEIGYSVVSVPHYWNDTYYSLIGNKTSL